LGAAADAWLERTESRHRLLTTPPSHITTAIGSPPTDPTGHAIWTTAAQEIDRYRQSVQLGPDIPGLGPRPERADDDRQCSNPACACTNSHASSTHGFPFANEHLTSRSSANQPCCYGHRASVHSCGGSNQPAPSRRHEPTPPRPRPRIDLHEPLLRASDAAALLGVPRSSVYEYARRHNDPLPSLAIGRHRRFCRSATESWPAGQTR
jgi:excisionase family DNA binding protein